MNLNPKRFVVAVSKKEADDLAAVGLQVTKDAALKILREIKKPPTDPFYAQQYRIYEVSADASTKT
jgi:hypothetical protein